MGMAALLGPLRLFAARRELTACYVLLLLLS